MHSQARMQGRLFLRKMLDVALEDAPSDVFEDPLRVFESGKTLLISNRVAHAIGQAGYRVQSMRREYGRVGEIRKRMELEDLIDTALVSAGRQLVRNMEVNDQARDAVAQRIWDCLHARKVVLTRRS